MGKLIVRGPHKLEGTVKASGAKNASLPIMAASLLTRDTVYLKRIPDLVDVRTESLLLQQLNADIQVEDGEMKICGKGRLKTKVPAGLGSQIRYSLLMLGLLLARERRARIPLPGGCKIGTRKYDMHLEGLRAMGADVRVTDEFIEANAPMGLKGAYIEFYYPTFSGTMNIMIAATSADGVTIIRNAAVNPEVLDFSCFLLKIGAEIEGIGTNVLKIRGRKPLHGCQHTVMADRIETATYLIAGAITGGDIIVQGCDPKYIQQEIRKLRAAGVCIEEVKQGLRVIGPERPRAVSISTSAYPGFHTDIQPLFSTLMTLADGKSIIKEIILENRFTHLMEIDKMGANIDIVDGDFTCVNGKRSKIAIIEGVDELRGAPVLAHDLRGGAALILAGLAAKGETVIDNVSSIDRGYEQIDEKLSTLGADIRRIQS